MVLFYLAAGVNHFRSPDFYFPLIPDWMGYKQLINAVSGIAEIVLAAMLLSASWRRQAAQGIVLMLLAFLPAHIWFIQRGGCVDPGGLCVPVWVAWVRLLIIHPLLIAWACSHTKTKAAKVG